MGWRQRQSKKRRLLSPRCALCGYDEDPAALQTHRLVPGSQGGTYALLNTVALCPLCHSRHHLGTLEIDSRKYLKSNGRYELRVVDGGEEKYLEVD